MANKKYKIGDKVVLRDNRGMSADIGAIGIILDIGSYYFNIKWIKNHRNQDNGNYNKTRFIKKSATTAKELNEYNLSKINKNKNKKNL